MKEIKQGDRVWLGTTTDNSHTKHLLCPKHYFSALTHLYECQLAQVHINVPNVFQILILLILSDPVRLMLSSFLIYKWKNTSREVKQGDQSHTACKKLDWGHLAPKSVLLPTIICCSLISCIISYNPHHHHLRNYTSTCRIGN